MAEGLSLSTDHGVVVSDLEPEGPAAHGGVETDDVIVGMNGKPMATLHQLEANVYRLSPGAKVNLRIQRGENQMDVPVITEEESGEELDALADLVDPVKNVVPQLGIVGLDINKQVLQLMPELRRPAGVVVAAHKASAPYTGPALQTGDVIYAANRQVVSGVAQLRETLGAMKSGQAVVLLVERSGHLIYVPLELD
jgi:serine protease Do